MTALRNQAARAILSNPLTNKGTAFNDAERTRWRLHGLLPPHIGTLESQIARRKLALAEMSNDFHRYVFLRDLQDSNEVLFHALIQSDLQGMLPLVYTPAVGEGCERFSEIWRHPRGLFLSWPNRHRIKEILAEPQFDRIKVIVVSDGERILGLGDQGAGGMGIPIGKLALYTACAGIHPAEVLPILLDVGTDNARLRDDPLYIGWRAPRVRGADYDAFLEAFVSAVEHRFPGVLLQWEDFAGKNAYDLLGRYRARVLSFNDDIQGTAATAVGTLLAAVRRTGTPLPNNRFVLFGAGAAGSGVAELLVAVLCTEGLSEAAARSLIWAVDRDGLVVADQPGLPPQQQALARQREELAHWPLAGRKAGLQEVVAAVRPTVLIGTSGQRGAFDEAIVQLMAKHCDQPIIFPLSNPTSRSEADPADLLAWTGGRAIVGSGSPSSAPGVAQVNNVYVFPGVGLGALACGARSISDGMFLAAARRLGSLGGDGGALLPPIDDLRAVALDLAEAVADQARKERLTTVSPDSFTRSAIAERMWQARYDAG